MKPSDYYCFDDERKEIVFHRFDTPSPWINYLTNGTFFTMISQAGGNLSWYRSPEIWRIGRYGFFTLPTDEQGMFLYLKDKKTGKIWNPNFLPTHTALDSFESRHGLGYSRFLAEKDGVKAELTVYVGEENALIYHLSLICQEDREMEIITAKEMGNMEYLREIMWQQYTKQSNNIVYHPKSDSLVYDYFIDMQPHPEETPYVFATSSLSSSSHTGSRLDFCGSYHDLRDAVCLTKGICPNTDLIGGEGIFAFTYPVFLKAGEHFEADFFLGTCSKQSDPDEVAKRYREKGFAKKQWDGLQRKWKERLSKFQVHTSAPDLDRMANVWNPYQAYTTFLVCREISFAATGCGRGVGVRDSMQDCISNVVYDPKSTESRIAQILAQQYQDGHANHTFFPFEDKPSWSEIRSDDHLWAVFSVHELIEEKGDVSYLSHVVPYYDGGEGTVLEHLRKAVDFSLSHVGKDGLPLLFTCDWNDNIGGIGHQGKAETIMVAEQLVLALKNLAELLSLCGQDGSHYQKEAERVAKIINEKFFADGRYARAVTDSGIVIGKAGDLCGSLWLNSNSWAVLADVADERRGNEAMDLVMKGLNTPIGLKIQTPALKAGYPSKEEELSWATEGIGENGGIFCHANTWGIMALAKLRRGDDAYQVYSELMPCHVMEEVGPEVYRMEPYVYCSNIRSEVAPRGGEAAISWVTGTATWMNYAVQHSLFGISPRFDSLHIEPCLPSSLKEAEVTRIFQGCTYRIHIENKGGKKVTLYQNGVALNSLDVKPSGKEIELTAVIE